MRVLFTFDIEEWFHPFFGEEQSMPEIWDDLDPEFPDMVNNLVSVINKLNGKCILFVVGWLAEKYPKEILLLASTGAVIGSHGYFHSPVDMQRESEFDFDIIQSKNALERAIKTQVELYRAPGFSITKSNSHLLTNIYKVGYSVDSSLVSERKIEKHVNLLELPPVGFRIFGFDVPISGGFFFRLVPLSIFRFINSLFVGKGVLNFYMHTWEMACGRRASMSKTKSWLQYFNIRNTNRKLDKLIEISEIVDPKLFIQKS